MKLTRSYYKDSEHKIGTFTWKTIDRRWTKLNITTWCTGLNRTSWEKEKTCILQSTRLTSCQSTIILTNCPFQTKVLWFSNIFRVFIQEHVCQ